jgi:hypothetical protein
MANTQTTVPAFVASQVLTAEEMTQSASTGVPVFATTVTRDAGFGGSGQKALAQGQLCYLEATDVVQYYDGSAWATLAPAAPAAASALTFIASTTFTTAVTLTMANVFSATYKNYLILVTSLVASADAGQAWVNLGTSSTKDTGSIYDYAVNATNNGAASNSQTLDAAKIIMLASYVGTSESAMTINIFNPNVATQTNLVSNNFGNRGLYLASEICNGYVGSSTQYTDFFLSTGGAPTHEATITVYGYSNS